MSKENSAPPLLFEPITIRGITAKNRIVVSPMCQYVSEGGMPNDWNLVHLGRYAFGGAGIIYGEETAVEERGRKSYECAGIWDDRHIAGYRRINEFLKALGAVPAIQLGHTGRKASCRGAMENFAPLTEEDAKNGLPPWQGLAPSALDQVERRFLPKEMDKDDITTVLNSFREAVRRSVDAGYEMIEIHGAHGYLLHQFLSPLSNVRTDAYGGDPQGRMRFPLEVAEVARDALPDNLPLSYRLSAVDGEGGVWGFSDAKVFAKELEARGVDIIDVSSGGIFGDTELPGVPRVQGYHVGFSEGFKKEVDALVMVVGLITEAQQAEDILQQGQADLIGMSRELMYHGDWPMHAARELGVENYFSLQPEPYAFRLRKREADKELAINAPDAAEKALDHLHGT
ncbi:MAG TPA: NADH:flavin oxidoreductase / NADH oxidase [Rhodospirillaceae bacterium]|nr:NADH:flavin oxidoreductase / NADH oxidase [Rhodospirillaceae bacterium]